MSAPSSGVGPAGGDRPRAQTMSENKYVIPRDPMAGKYETMPLLRDLLFKEAVQREYFGDDYCVGMLFLVVHEGKNMAHLDALAASDIYVQVSSPLVLKGKGAEKSRTISDYNPKWNHYFKVPVPAKGGVRLAVMDEDWKASEDLGTLDWTSEQCQAMPAQPESKWVTLEDQPANAKGELLLSMHFVPRDSQDISKPIRPGGGTLAEEALYTPSLAVEMKSKRCMKRFNRHWKANRKKLQTGDLVVTRSPVCIPKSDHAHFSDALTNNMIHFAIENGTGYVFTHACMVYATKHPVTGERRVFLIEDCSNADRHIDVIAHSTRRCIHVFDMEDQLRSSEASAWWIPLKTPFTDEQKDKLEQFVVAHWLRNPPYDMEAAIDLAIGVEKPPDYFEFNCVEFVLAAQRHAGLKEWQNLNVAYLYIGQALTFPCFDRYRVVLKLLDQHKDDKTLRSEPTIVHKSKRGVKVFTLTQYQELAEADPNDSMVRLDHDKIELSIHDEDEDDDDTAKKVLGNDSAAANAGAQAKEQASAARQETLMCVELEVVWANLREDLGIDVENRGFCACCRQTTNERRIEHKSRGCWRCWCCYGCCCMLCCKKRFT